MYADRGATEGEEHDCWGCQEALYKAGRTTVGIPRVHGGTTVLASQCAEVSDH